MVYSKGMTARTNCEVRTLGLRVQGYQILQEMMGRLMPFITSRWMDASAGGQTHEIVIPNY